VVSKNDLGEEVPKVIVHRVRVYDHRIGTVIVSQRMATEEGAKMMGGRIVPDTEI
jgi:hypothetical protein